MSSRWSDCGDLTLSMCLDNCSKCQSASWFVHIRLFVAFVRWCSSFIVFFYFYFSLFYSELETYLFRKSSWTSENLILHLSLFLSVRPISWLYFYLYLSVVCHSESEFNYNARFVIMLISLGSRNECYNEVAVYTFSSCAFCRRKSVILCGFKAICNLLITALAPLLVCLSVQMEYVTNDRYAHKNLHLSLINVWFPALRFRSSVSVSVPCTHHRRIRKNRTRSYLNGWTETANLRKRRTLLFFT